MLLHLGIGHHSDHSMKLFSGHKLYYDGQWLLKRTLCEYSNAYIVVKGTITITRTGTDELARQADEISNTKKSSTNYWLHQGNK